MSGILFLGNDDFQIRQGDQGLLLTLTYESKGLTLVLFYSKECPYCDQLINKFKQLPNYINGCQFAMVNVNRNISVVEKSKNTVAPITYVPDVILYVNGIPYMRYDGAHDIQHIKDFIFQVYQQIQKPAFSQTENHSQTPTQQPPQSFQDVSQQQPQQQPQDYKQPMIPAYTIGKPLCGQSKKDGVCYLNFENAYTKVK
jgi:thioredoxin-like negative regulator of GroEL